MQAMRAAWQGILLAIRWEAAAVRPSRGGRRVRKRASNHLLLLPALPHVAARCAHLGGCCCFRACTAWKIVRWRKGGSGVSGCQVQGRVHLVSSLHQAARRAVRHRAAEQAKRACSAHRPNRRGRPAEHGTGRGGTALSRTGRPPCAHRRQGHNRATMEEDILFFPPSRTPTRAGFLDALERAEGRAPMLR